MNDNFDWDQFDRGEFIVNVLAIIFDPRTKKILIGRRENDPYIEKLTWSFPGGRPAYDEDLEHYLKLEVKKKTNLDITVHKILFAKTYPEDRRFLSIYYLCKGGEGNPKPGEKFQEIRWVLPHAVKDYFTTSIHPELYKIITNLDRN